MKASYFTRKFEFNFPAGTSRGILYDKYSSFILLEETVTDHVPKPSGKVSSFSPADGLLYDSSANDLLVLRGIGECSTIPGLSPDPMDSYDAKLRELCEVINVGKTSEIIDLSAFPSIQFGLEMALQELTVAHQLSRESGKSIHSTLTAEQFIDSPHLLFPSDFTLGKKGIAINGLIWMGDKAFMKKQIDQKLADGYRCLKLKVGALHFETELSVIQEIRSHFSADQLELRLDANGAFTKENAMDKLKMLSQFHIHSIEQPIRQGQHETMVELCHTSPIPIALDEELISYPVEQAEELLLLLRPAYIILKPSLLGGFTASQQWIDAAEKTSTNWWVTSALESNIGLNAIAQWTFTLNNPLPQGLGTGQIYRNNFLSPLYNKNSSLMFKEEIMKY